MAKQIPLSRGMFALVDDADFENLSRYSWRVTSSVKPNRTLYYAVRSIYVNKKRIHIYMHRSLLDAPSDLQVDHRDGNGLNNQRGNLRLATQSQNNANNTSPKGQSRGVSWDRFRQRYVAQIKVNHKHIHLGRFTSESEAAQAYDKAALQYFGEFARPNNKT